MRKEKKVALKKRQEHYLKIKDAMKKITLLDKFLFFLKQSKKGRLKNNE